MKLKYKFFSVFLITSCIIVVLLLGSFNFFIYRNFGRFVSMSELDKMGRFSEAVKKTYEKYGFVIFKTDPGYWVELQNNYIEPGQKNREDEITRIPRPGLDRREGNPPQFLPPPFPPPPPRRDVLKPGYKLCLFDADKKPVIGAFSPEIKYAFREINLNGKTIGWLGLFVETRKEFPLGFGFLIKQFSMLIYIGGGIILLAALFALIMSKHLLEPVNRLMEGTKLMAKFKFDTKIDVRSGDELGTLADNFNSMAKTLKNYEEMRTQWISDISHELRTPIALLRSKLEAYQDGVRVLDMEGLNSLHRDVMRLSSLVNDLHEMTMEDSRSINMSTKKILPVEILRRVVSDFEGSINKNDFSVNLDTDFIPDNFYVKADETQIERVFSNILYNSLKYTDSPGEIRVSSYLSGEWLILLFEDSKPSVPSDELDKIFNRLHRVERSRNRKSGGSGLGLSICKKIIENHGGIISSDHSDLGGLKVIIKLPLITKK